MTEFRKASAHKKWVIGSLESDTGSEYLFGFDPEKTLMWLERPGHKYTSSDKVWGEAEAYIRASALGGSGPVTITSEDPDTGEQYVEEQATVQVAAASSDERPKRVTRSVMGSPEGFGDYGKIKPGDPRIVGDFSEDGVDYSDDNVAAQAAEFLANLGDYGGEDG